MSVKQLMTAEELWEMPEVPGKSLELVDGELIEATGAGTLHMLIVAMMFDTIKDFVRQHNLGLVVPDGLAYVLRRGPDLVRVPDVSFVALENLPAGDVPKGFWEGSPTLAVEVVSPNDRANDIHAKVRHYLEAGTRQVWVLWPEQQSLTVYAPDGGARELGPDSRLGGGDVLHGFSVRVGDSSRFSFPDSSQPACYPFVSTLLSRGG